MRVRETGKQPGTSLAALAAIVLAAAAGGGTAVAGPANYSSHDAAFFTELLAGRVWLYERPNSFRAGDRGLVWGVHHAADGTARACFHLDATWQTVVGRWRVVPSPRFRALYNYQEAGSEPDPGHVRGHVPLFYDPLSGRLHSESVGGDGWVVLSLGWVQESWPRALKEACPDLELPAEFPVNKKQTASVMEEVVAQDPEAALRAAPGLSLSSPGPGSALQAPGSTGLALAAGAPTVTGKELARFLVANDGFVLESPAGVRLVLALGPERDELWRLDAEGAVVDTAALIPTADGTGVSIQWERLPRRQDYRVGDPFPLRPTGERHAAFLLTDRFIAAQRAVLFPFGEHGEVAVRFHEGGFLSGADGDVGGRWWWSRGDLHVALDGIPEIGAYPWPALVAQETRLLGADALRSGGENGAQ